MLNLFFDYFLPELQNSFEQKKGINYLNRNSDLNIYNN